MSSSEADEDPDGAPPTLTPAGTQTLVRGLRILEAMSERTEPTGVGELARLVDLPKSTVQRLLRTLDQEGWAQVTADPVTRWRLSPRMLALARRGTPSRTLQEMASPHIAALGERTGETIHLSVPDRDVRLVLIDRVDSVHAVRTFNAIGASTALHASASGKAFLSKLTDAEIDEILSRPLEKPMPNTSIDPQHLMHQILEARERGYAVNISENRANVCAVGAAVVDTAGAPAAAVAISMPDIRFEPTRVPEWGSWVRETAEAIGDTLGG